jgi:cell division protein FtsL
MLMGRFALLLLTIGCFSSALAVVYSTHQSRKLFAELQNLQKGRDDLDVEWGRLQLEQSTFATHGYIEAVARERLGMHMPKPDAVVIVKP